MAVFTRTINTQDSRMIQKLSTVSGQVPTVAPSDNHVDGTWDSLDVYIGELFMNSADGKMWCRTSNGIKEIFIVPSTVANGDTFYLNASGGITRLPIGTSGQVLSVSSGNVPKWSDISEPVTFKKSFSAAECLAGIDYDIVECPAPGVGFAWECLSVCAKYTYGTVAYDTIQVQVFADSAGNVQFIDDDTIANKTTNLFFNLRQVINVAAPSIVENEQLIIQIPGSTTGNGTLIVYGTARKITL